MINQVTQNPQKLMKMTAAEKQKKTIISDAGDLIFQGKAYTKQGFYEFIKTKTSSSLPADAIKEKVINTYRFFRDRAFTDNEYSYWQACQDALTELGFGDQ